MDDWAMARNFPWCFILVSLVSLPCAHNAVYAESPKEAPRSFSGAEIEHWIQESVSGGELRTPRSITLNNGVSDKNLEPIVAFAEHVEYVCLSQADVSDRCFSILSRLPKTQEIDFSFTPVTGKGIGQLGRLPKLKSLSLAFTQVNDNAASELAELKALQVLDLPGCDGITDRSATYLKDLHVSSLDLSATSIADEGVLQLSGMRNLERLWLTDTAVTARGLEGLANNAERLELLNISETKVAFSDLDESVRFPRVRSLYLGDTSTADADIGRVVRAFPNLKTLDLTSTRVSNRAVPELLRLQDLTSIRIGRTQIDDNGVKALLTQPKMRSVTISKNQWPAGESRDIGGGKILVFEPTFPPE